MAETFEWAGEMGQTWARHQAALDRKLATAGEAGLAALAPASGEAVLDLGCGAGATTAALLRAVGPAGRVTGLDISSNLVAVARARPDCTGAEFLVGDAQTMALPEAAYDALFSRFGCMFFADPVATFANLRQALKSEARAVLVAWQAPALNAYAAIPAAVGTELLGPAEPAAPGTPGPFAWAEPEVFHQILAGAGFGDIAWEEVRITQTVGADDGADPADRAARLLTRIGNLARRLRDQPEALSERAREMLRPRLEPYVSEGWVRLPAAIWVIRARA